MKKIETTEVVVFVVKEECLYKGRKVQFGHLDMEKTSPRVGRLIEKGSIGRK